MNARNFISVGLLLLLSSLNVAAEEFDTQKLRNWHQLRGPLATGEAPQGNPPTEWSETKNIHWKTPLPGRGNAAPIVWEDQIFILTAIDTGKVDASLPKPADQPKRPFGIRYPNTVHAFVVICLDRKTGKEVWRQTAAEKIPHQGHHGDNSFASASPTTDGERLYAWFGSVGMFCYDLSGKQLWKRDLGEVDTRLSFGEGSSPIVAGDRVILVRDNEGQSKIIALSTETGETVWEANRDESSAWATPIAVDYQGKTQIVTNSGKRVRSYDLADGTLLWECGGQVSNVTPSPVTDGELVYCMSGYRGSAAVAMPLSAKGDITDSDQVAWTKSRGTPYIPSPVLYQGRLYFNQSNDAILSAVEAKTGKVVIERTRLPSVSRLYSSPVAAADKIYYFDRGGAALVFEHAEQFEALAENKLAEGIDASPAIVGNQIFVRGEKSLYCIGKP